MAEAKATVPDFQVSTEVDMAAAVAVREQLKALATDEHPAPSYNDFVVKAAALALREFPRANGAYKDGRFELYERVNVGVAVAAEDALIVPTIFDADQKSIGEIALEARALAARVRAGAITPPELSGGTFTVSNLGMFGVTEFTAIVNAGQAGDPRRRRAARRPGRRRRRRRPRQAHDAHARQRPPHPLRRRRRPGPRPHPRPARVAARPGALTRCRRRRQRCCAAMESSRLPLELEGSHRYGIVLAVALSTVLFLIIAPEASWSRGDRAAVRRAGCCWS